jgi:hypothetical protein
MRREGPWFSPFRIWVKLCSERLIGLLNQVILTNEEV